MGLGDFFKGVGDAATNALKAQAYLVNPTHWDDVVEGVGGAANFVAKNPGKTWDTGFEVGRAMVKDQLDPVNLAITAGLTAASVATAGAASPLLMAKLGLSAKTVQAGITATKGIDTGMDAMRAVKAVDTATDIARTTSKASKIVATHRQGLGRLQADEPDCAARRRRGEAPLGCREDPRQGW